MCCTPTRRVNININGCSGFMPFMPMPFMPMCGYPPMHCGWGMNPSNIFGFAAGAALGGLAFRGISSLFNKLA